MNFEEVLGTSWKIAWENKVLWLFAAIMILAAFLFLPLVFIVDPPFLSFLFPSLAEWVSQPWGLLLPVGVLILMFVVMYLANAWAMTAVDLGVLRAERQAEKLSFGEIARDSLPFFRRVLGLMGLYLAAALLLMTGLVAVAVLLSLITFGFALFCLAPLILILIPAICLSRAFLDMTIAAILVENCGILAAVKRIWDLFRKWPGAILLMTMIVYWGLGMVSGFVALPFILPASFFSVLMVMNGNILAWALAGGMCALAYLPIFTILNSLFIVFMCSVWMITYLRLSSAKPAWQTVSLENA